MPQSSASSSLPHTKLTRGAVRVELWRDPEDRPVASHDQTAIREKMLDKTLADSYPASDPPSTLPNPSDDSLCLSEDAADRAA